MPKPMFQCEICGNIHTTKAFAEKCESSHLTPEKHEYVYDRADGKGQYPTTVKLWFGKQCCQYKRESR